ncbi:MAG TPA: hypothetical protein VIZ65_05130 [Cellvibrionaceae bacterium]
MLSLDITPREQERIFSLLSNSANLINNPSQNFHFYPLLIICTSAIEFENNFLNTIKKNQQSLDTADLHSVLRELIDTTNAKNKAIIGNMKMSDLNSIYTDLINGRHHLTATNDASHWYAEHQRSTQRIPGIQSATAEPFKMQKHIDLILRSNRFIKS